MSRKSRERKEKDRRLAEFNRKPINIFRSIEQPPQQVIRWQGMAQMDAEITALIEKASRECPFDDRFFEAIENGMHRAWETGRPERVRWTPSEDSPFWDGPTYIDLHRGQE